MADRARLVKSWRQIAAEVAQEPDPEKRKQMCGELLRAVEAKKCNANANDRFHPATQLANQPVKKTPPVRPRAV